MRFPIPGYRAKTAAKDLASDARKLCKETMELKRAIDNGECNQNDVKQYTMQVHQIRSICETEFYCTETGNVYKVSDYATSYNEYMAQQKEAKLKAFYLRILKYLKH